MPGVLRAAQRKVSMENEKKIYEINDPFANTLGLTVDEVRPDGLTVKVQIRSDFCNSYKAAHGGFAFSAGEIAAELSAKLCLGRPAAAVDAACMYECSLMGKSARIVTKLIDAAESQIVYRVRVLDGKGKLCMSQIITLRDADVTIAPNKQFKKTIFAAGDDDPIDPVTGVAYPHLSLDFAAFNGIHVIGRGEKGLIYGLDVREDTCDVTGAAHASLIYTVCDCVTGGSVAFLLDKKPVTVSSSIHYLRRAVASPIRAEARLVRNGKQLLFYNVDVLDAEDNRVAIAQFTMQSVDYNTQGNLPADHRIHAFKD